MEKKKFLVLFNSEKLIMKSLSRKQLKLYNLLRKSIVEYDFDFGIALTSVIKSQKINSDFEKNLNEVVEIFKSIHSNSDKHPINLIQTMNKINEKFIQDSCKYFTELKQKRESSVKFPLINYLKTSQNLNEKNEKVSVSVQDGLENQYNQDVNDPPIDIVIDNVIDNVNKKEKNKKEKSKKFIPPTLEEVTAYCQERHNNVNPEQFIAYYEANGWKVGRNPMKNWRAAIVSTWERNNYNKAPPSTQKKFDVGEYLLEQIALTEELEKNDTKRNNEIDLVHEISNGKFLLNKN